MVDIFVRNNRLLIFACPMANTRNLVSNSIWITVLQEHVVNDTIGVVLRFRESEMIKMHALCI